MGRALPSNLSLFLVSTNWERAEFLRRKTVSFTAVILNLEPFWTLKSLKNPTAQATPEPHDSRIYTGWDAGMSNFLSSPGDSSMQPSSGAPALRAPGELQSRKVALRVLII